MRREHPDTLVPRQPRRTNLFINKSSHITMDKTYAIPDFLMRHARRIGSATLVSALLLANAAAQNVSLYSFSSSGGGTLDPMSSASVLIGSGQDDTPSSVTGIGFAFNYEGTNYTDFSVNSNGGMKLGGSQISGSAINFNLTSNPLVLLPYSGDGTTANGSVTTALTGTSPNQIRVVQWNVGMDYSVSSANCLYQVWLYEGSNVIEFRYGAGAPSGSFSGGIQVAITGATATNYLNVLSNLTASTSNTTLFTTTNAWPGNGTILTFSPPAPCTPPPAPGQTVASISSGCSGFSSALSLQNNTPGSGVSYQWQSSPNGVDTWTNVGANSATYTTTALSATTWFQCLVTCSTGPSTVNSTPVQLTVTEPAVTYFTYAGAQYSEAFATWGNRCSTGDVPSLASNHWKNTPAFGAGTWRASNTTAGNAGWESVGGAAGTTGTTQSSIPTSVAVTQPAARFHSRQGGSVTGTLDFHVNMSAATGSEFLRFEYINSAGAGTLQVLVSQDGGSNFTSLGTLGATNVNGGAFSTWYTQQFTIGSTSATTVIRLKGTAPATAQGSGGNDLAVDNFRIIPAATCAAPTAPTASVTAPGTADIGWTCASCTGNFYVEYKNASFTPGSGLSAGGGTMAGPFTSSPATISGLTAGNYTAYVRRDCGGGNGFSDNAGPVTFSIVNGDFCANAIDLTTVALTPDFTNTFGNTTGASNNYTTSTCASQPGRDVVLYYDVAPGATLQLGLWSSVNRLTVAYGGSCPGTTTLACSAGGYFTTPNPNVQQINDYETLVWTNPGCNTERVYVLVDAISTGGPVYSFNYVYTPAAGTFCSAVTGIAVSTVNTGSSADVSWNNTCSGSVVVEYGPAGFTPGAGANAGGGITAAINGTSTTLNGLTLDQPYDVYVRNDCGAGQYSTNGTPIQFTIINGDDCTRVIDLSAETSPFFGTTTGASNAVSVHDCGTFNGGDILLSYPVGDGATISFFAAHDYAATVSVNYGPSCPGSNTLICENDLSEFSWTNTTGSTQTVYWIQDGSTEGDFSLEWIYEPPCNNDITLEFRSDAPNQTTWEIRDANTNSVVRSGGPLNGSPETNSTCLPDGCYVLRVLDSGGDGMIGGGYVLRTAGDNLRIIDNTGNFNSGSVSAISGNQGFCLPIGTDRTIFTSCDKLDWVTGKFIVASANAAVSGQFGVTNSTSGYEFWFFDPNGSYSFRRFRNHATSDGTGTGATRACHFRINGWTNTVSTPHLPANTLLNVRVRGRVAGSNLEFGPACLFKIDAALAACPRVSLQDNPADSDYSCGVSRTFGGANSASNKLVAAAPQIIPAVASTNIRYQFRFRIPGEYPAAGSCIVRPIQTSPTLYLNWTSGERLKCNTQYDVDMRVSKDGGATWCAANGAPTCASPQTIQLWGKVCKVNITSSTFCPVNGQGGASNLAVENTGDLTMYPNPNRGDQLFINLNVVEKGVNTVSVDIFDLTGKKVTARTIAVQDGTVKTALELNGDLSNGMYLVNITAGSKAYTERLVIQH